MSSPPRDTGSMAGVDDVYASYSRTSTSSSDIPLMELGYRSKNSRSRPIGHVNILGLLVAVMLLVINGIWAWSYAVLSASESPGEFSDRKHWLSRLLRRGLISSFHYLDNSATRVRKPFHWNTPFSDDDKNVSNPLWADLFPRK